MNERSGMGETGESYLVGPDKLMRSDSYLDPDNHTVSASFADPVKGKVDTQASRDVLSGKTGKEIIIDYNGNPVLSAYTPIKVGDTNWGLWVEIDQAEAFRAIWSIKIDIAVIAVIAGVLIVLIAMLIARSITIPIKKGVNMAQKMSEGDLTQRLDLDQEDEIGLLSQALNMMCSNLGQMFNNIITDTQTLNTASTTLSDISEQISSNAQSTAGRSTNVASAAQATEEISSKVSGVQAVTMDSVDAIKAIVEIINEINSIVSSVAVAIEEQSATTQEIADNVSHAAQGLDSVNKTADAAGEVANDISDVSKSTDEMKTGSQKVMTSAGELSTLAGALKEMMERFKI